MANKRLREIVRVFSSVGFTTLKERKKPLDEQMAPAKLRLAFEQLGPSFVKLGRFYRLAVTYYLMPILRN